MSFTPEMFTLAAKLGFSGVEYKWANGKPNDLDPALLDNEDIKIFYHYTCDLDKPVPKKILNKIIKKYAKRFNRKIINIEGGKKC